MDRGRRVNDSQIEVRCAMHAARDEDDLGRRVCIKIREPSKRRIEGSDQIDATTGRPC
ncbi:MAG: hypothetical protein R2715_21795 [Ilumatobacteraceae bacterium]